MTSHTMSSLLGGYKGGHMAKINRLSAVNLNSLPTGKYNDGQGLWLNKRTDGGAQWFLRVTVFGRRREMGLGPYPDVKLKEARETAADARKLVREGKDPIVEREKRRLAGMQSLHLFRDIAKDAFESRKAELKGDGKAGRWFSPLELHVLPKLGRVPVVEIDQIKIRDALKPIWHDKAETARKALNRVAIALRHASNLGLDVDIQAAEKARGLLGKQRHEVKHVPALPWQDVPAFYATLNDGSITHLALRFLILTGMRSKAVRFAHIDQFERNVWTVPATNMKGRKGQVTDFRVPLSSEAQAVFHEALPLSRDGYLFPSVRKGVISDATMARFMERKGMEARPHGFRTSLRTWLAEETDASWELAEMCLAHQVGNKVARAYVRTDRLDARRGLLEEWARHCENPAKWSA